MIYIIECVGTEYVKIGVANGRNTAGRYMPARKRAEALQTGCPFELRVLVVADWCDSAEPEIHRYLSADRVRGEWFRRSPRVDLVLECLRKPAGFFDFRDALKASSNRKAGTSQGSTQGI